MTLLVTVLLALAGASIALVLLGQGLFSSASNATQGRAAAATAALQVAEGGFQAALAQDPYFWQSTVFVDAGDSVAERPRVCTGGTVVQPGSAWPSSCGTYWTYAASTGTLSERTVVQITPPSLANPLLTVDFLAHAGCPAGTYQQTLSSCASAVGQQLTYRLGGAGSFTVYSENSLNLNALAPNEPSGATQGAVLSGTIYSAGQIALSTSGAVSLSGAELEAENGFVGGGATAGNVYAAGGVSNCATQPTVGTLGTASIVNIRCVQPTPLNGAGLSDGVVRAITVACMPSSSANVTIGSLSYSNELCLRQGQSLTTTSGANVTVPSSVNGYLLVPGGNAAGVSNGGRTVDVYTYTDATAVTPAGTLPTPIGGCAIACTYVNLAKPDVAANASPGAPGYWTLLGTFWLPYSGVISTDADTVVGLCGSNFVTSSACTTAPASDGGFTVIAGTPAQPRNLFIGNSTPTYTSSVALEATGDIVFPYWGHDIPTSLVSGIFTDQSGIYIDASLVALGAGQSNTDSAIVTEPTNVQSAPSSTANQSMLLDVNGSIEASAVDLGSMGMFAHFVFSAPAGLATSPAPWFAGPQVAWVPASSQPLALSSYAALGG